jgi:hypothetical protein
MLVHDVPAATTGKPSMPPTLPPVPDRLYAVAQWFG